MTRQAIAVAAFLTLLLSLNTVQGAEPICGKGSITAVAVSGGGAKGAFEAGALYHLIVHRDNDIQDFSGVSAGALNVSYLAQAKGGEKSLDNLKCQAKELVKVWLRIKGTQDLLEPRCLGLAGVALFGTESLYDFTPFRELLERSVNPWRLYENQKKGHRYLRVGVVSFYDGKYFEIEPISDKLVTVSQFNDYIYASSLIPIYGEMPRIPGKAEESDTNVDHWPQYADGGLRHMTPVTGYFPARNVDVLRFAQVHKKDLCENLPQGILPRPNNICRLFVIVSGPYSAESDALPPPGSCQDPLNPIKAESNGLRILERTVTIGLRAPYRWDINYALVANNMLSWRDGMIEKLRNGPDSVANEKMLSALPSDFPVCSYNKQGGIDHQYEMAVIAPLEHMADTYEFDCVNIRKQLREGCEAANKAVIKAFKGAPNLTNACKEFEVPAEKDGCIFPPPERESEVCCDLRLSK